LDLCLYGLRGFAKEAIENLFDSGNARCLAFGLGGKPHQFGDQGTCTAALRSMCMPSSMGETPGALPIEQPTRFPLIINLKTASTLGVPIAPALLRAPTR